MNKIGILRNNDIQGQQEQLFSTHGVRHPHGQQNHALLRQADGSWRLSPAFDIVPSMSGFGYQAMSVGRDGSDSTLDHALSSTASFGLKLAAGKVIVQEVASVVEGWRRHMPAK